MPTSISAIIVIIITLTRIITAARLLLLLLLTGLLWLQISKQFTSLSYLNLLSFAQSSLESSDTLGVAYPDNELLIYQKSHSLPKRLHKHRIPFILINIYLFILLFVTVYLHTLFRLAGTICVLIIVLY